MAGVPRVIGPEALEVAETIDQEVNRLLAESGLRRVNPTGATKRDRSARAVGDR